MTANLSQTGATQEQAASAAATAIIAREAPGADKTIAAVAATRSVDISLSLAQKTAFGRLLGRETSTVAVQAKTGYTIAPVPVCLLAVDTQGTALSFSGSGKFIGPDCMIWSNASSATASMDLKGSANITALVICAAGKVSMGNATKASPAPKEYCGTLEDPLAAWTPPSVNTTCAVSNQTLTTLTPGKTYCGSNRLSSTNIVLSPGIYVIKDGTLEITGTGKVEGTGVQFITVGSGAIRVSAGTDLKLSAPIDTSGSQVLLAQSGTASIATSSFTGNSKLHLDGSIHIPSQNLELTGNATVIVEQPSATVIAKRISVGGSGTVEFKGRHKSKAPDSAGIKRPEVRLIQ